MQWLATMDHWVALKAPDPLMITLLNHVAHRATEQGQPWAWLNEGGLAVSSWPPEIPWDASWLVLVDQWHELAHSLLQDRTVPCRRGIIAGTQVTPNHIPWIGQGSVAVVEVVITERNDQQIGVRWTWVDDQRRMHGEDMVWRSDLTQSIRVQGKRWPSPLIWRKQTASYYWWASPTQGILPIEFAENDSPGNPVGAFDDLVRSVGSRIQRPGRWIFATGHRETWSVVLQSLANHLVRQGTSVLMVHDSETPWELLSQVSQAPHTVWLWNNWRGRGFLRLPEAKSGVVVFHGGHPHRLSEFQWPLVPPGTRVVYEDLTLTAQQQIVLTDEYGQHVFQDQPPTYRLLRDWFSWSYDPRGLWQSESDPWTTVWATPPISDCLQDSAH
ncbi:hypothetical protein [Sulfobacillus thermosulfidooxidans]|uniref:hypothetical protein n=1 Tax=Sulfobacillus thermosulfidooxidans TaxID=28034 RepID=UPI0006B4FE65|nr:hypothetical protein [Sulfobacillus thermosulfidooxidans]